MKKIQRGIELAAHSRTMTTFAGLSQEKVGELCRLLMAHGQGILAQRCKVSLCAHCCANALLVDEDATP